MTNMIQKTTTNNKHRLFNFAGRMGMGQYTISISISKFDTIVIRYWPNIPTSIRYRCLWTL